MHPSPSLDAFEDLPPRLVADGIECWLALTIGTRLPYAIGYMGPGGKVVPEFYFEGRTPHEVVGRMEQQIDRERERDRQLAYDILSRPTGGQE